MKAAVCYFVLIALWQNVVVPRFPPHEAQSETDFGPLHWIESLGAFNSEGDVDRASSLIIGDSRSQAAIELGALNEAGIGDAAMLWLPGAQLEQLIPASRSFPARRIVVCLSTMSLRPNAIGLHEMLNRGEGLPSWGTNYDAEFDAWKVARTKEMLASGINPLAVKRCFIVLSKVHRSEAIRTSLQTDAIDARFSDWADTLRTDLVRTILPVEWSQSWFDKRDLHRSDKLYSSLVDEYEADSWKATRTTIKNQLIALREDGWDVVCVRLPLAPGLLKIEERVVRSEEFTELCQAAEVPYIDYSKAMFETFDGSHLTKAAAVRFTNRLARDLNLRTR